jgi:hypothetical protein
MKNTLLSRLFFAVVIIINGFVSLMTRGALCWLIGTKDFLGEFKGHRSLPSRLFGLDA